MRTHPYIRGYMAGIVVPTLFLLLVMTGYFVWRFVVQVPVPIERVIVFPMAAVPNLWGLWNMLYVRLRQGHHLPIGVHGMLLVFVLSPFGVAVASAGHFLAASEGGLTYFGMIHVNYGLAALALCAALTVYYLVWKYFVNFFNELLGVA